MENFSYLVEGAIEQLISNPIISEAVNNQEYDLIVTRLSKFKNMSKEKQTKNRHIIIGLFFTAAALVAPIGIMIASTSVVTILLVNIVNMILVIFAGNKMEDKFQKDMTKDLTKMLKTTNDLLSKVKDKKQKEKLQAIKLRIQKSLDRSEHYEG